jgi:uncharacterized repeat protein (TIGR04076 family)
MTTLKVKVKEIKGNCPVYKRDDSFLIVDGYKLETDKPICMHSLASIMPYYVALGKGVSPKELGLGDKGKAYVQCLDPCKYTGGGTVIFEIEREG